MLALKILLLLFVSTSAYVDVPPSKDQFVDKKFLLKQKSILEVCQHILQDEVHTQLWADSKNFSIECNLNSYTCKTVVQDFLRQFNQGFISVEETFNIQSYAHKQQAFALINILLAAVDWKTFYLTMGWAR